MPMTKKQKGRQWLYKLVRRQRAKVMGHMIADGIPAEHARHKTDGIVIDWWHRFNEESPDEPVSINQVRAALAGTQTWM